MRKKTKDCKDEETQIEEKKKEDETQEEVV